MTILDLLIFVGFGFFYGYIIGQAKAEIELGQSEGTRNG